MTKVKQFFSGMDRKRIVLMCILSVLLVMVVAGAAFASEPSIADNIDTIMGTAGDDLEQVIYNVAPTGMKIAVIIIGITLGVKLIKRLAR